MQMPVRLLLLPLRLAPPDEFQRELAPPGGLLLAETLVQKPQDHRLHGFAQFDDVAVRVIDCLLYTSRCV